MVRIMVLYSEDSSVDSRFSIGLIPKWASRISLSSLNNSCLIISEFKIKIILVLQFFLIKLRTSGLTICMSSLGPLNDVLKFLNYLAKPRKALAVWVTLNWLRPLLISLIPLIFISRSTSSGSVILISRSAEADSEADAPHVLVLRNPSISSSSLISFFRCSVVCSGGFFFTYLVGLRTGESMSGISSSRILSLFLSCQSIPVFSIAWIPWVQRFSFFFADQRLSHCPF